MAHKRVWLCGLGALQILTAPVLGSELRGAASISADDPESVSTASSEPRGRVPAKNGAERRNSEGLRGTAGPNAGERGGTSGTPTPERKRNGDAAGKDSTETQPSVNTWSIFGFTEGSDTDKKGGQTLYTSSTGRFSRRESRFAALHGSVGYSYSPTDEANVWVEASSDYQQSSGTGSDAAELRGSTDETSGLRSSVSFGLSGAIKYQFLKRESSPIGLSVQVAPYWSRAWEAGGAEWQTVGSEFRVLADAALVPDRVYGAVNVSYTPESSSSAGLTERTSSLEASGAVAARIGENVFLGAELRYLTIYEGLGFNDGFLGWALFAGPTARISLGGKGYINAAWSAQLVGRAASTPGLGLDLVNYERHQIRVKTGFYF